MTPSGGSATTFAYDANGIRTKTVQPGGITTYFPFPGYEETVNGANTIKRSTYSFAGQTVALRVSGDPVSGNNGLFYVLSDHLGSTSMLVNSSGGVVAGSTTRNLPYGGYRPGSAPTQTITDRDFTGQKENMELGLLYYRARFYVPGIGRFASADTIVPNPASPQSYNRYSYVLNSPVNLVDPSGHAPSDGCDYEGCDLADFMNPDETWVDSTGQHYHYDPVLAAQYHEYDSFDAIGVIGEIEGVAVISGQAGVELVYNFETGDITLFVIIGGGGNYGTSVSGDATIDFIFNIGDDNLNFMGPFHYAEAGIAAGPGVVAGHAWTPNDEKGILPYSVYLGPRVGVGANVGGGRVEYIPIATTNFETGETEYHLDDYLYGDLASVNSINQFLLPTGPYRLLYDALETAISEYD